MDLVIDNREQDRIDDAKEYFKDKCNVISVLQLDSADYVFKENDVTVSFEYKTAEDFLNSVTNHRVFNECYSMIKDYDYSFLIVEGNFDYAINRFWYSKKLSYNKEQIYGAFRRLRTLCPVIVVNNPRKSGKVKDDSLRRLAFEEMYKQAQKCVDGKTLYLNDLKAVKTKNPCISLLCMIKGVSFNTAKRITSQLGLYTQADYFKVTKEDLESVNGIGSKKAESIIKQRGELYE